MDSFEADDSIAVGSTGTLLSLIGKEMEILQARKSCSVSSFGVMSQRSLSAKWGGYQYNPYNTARNLYTYESPAPTSNTFASNSSAASIVSSMWSDLKGLLRSPTSIHHGAVPNGHQYHNSIFFYKRDIIDYGDDDDDHAEQLDATIFGKTSVPRKSITPISKTYPTGKCPAVVVDSCSRKSNQSRSRLKGKATEEWHCTATPRALVADTASREAVDTHAAASTSVAWTDSRSCVASNIADHTQKLEKQREEKAASRKSSSYSISRRRDERELTVFCKLQQADEERRDQERGCFQCECGCSCAYCMQQLIMQKQYDDELLYAYGDHPYHSNVLMRTPLMLRVQPEQPVTPAPSPNVRVDAPCHHNNLTTFLKPSRSLFGGRSNLAGVSVVDLQCCHSSTSSLLSTPTTRRLSFTRLSHS